MKQQFERRVSMMLALVMIVGLLSGLTVHTQAAGKDYVYNWGARGDVATSLSDYATDFYSDNNVSYQALAVLSGAEDVDAVPESPLYSELKTLMVSNHTHITTYAETRDLYRYTDCQNGGGVISSFYSGTSIGPDWDGTWNREHTWPNSKGLGGSDEDDIMMLRPTVSTENSGRGNTAYGKSAGYYNPNGESNGAYDLRGDVARIALYVYTRWGNTAYMWNRYGVIESKEVLLEWMVADPVDTWEMGRNDAVQSITGTRNVFVDFPELAFVLFGEEIPSMTTPSGNAAKSNTITVTASDDTMGTVSLDGNVITATPVQGYRVTGYQIIRGSATVTRSGNVFTVAAFSDCEIEILFGQKVPATVSYISDGIVLATGQTQTDDSILLPEYTGTAPEGFTFVGWSDEPVTHIKEQPSVYQPGEHYTVTENTKMYALFSYVSTSSSDGVWKLVTDASQLVAGNKIVLAAAKGEKQIVSGPMNGAYLSEVITSFSDDLSTIPNMPENAQIFTLGGQKGAWTLSTDDGKLLGATNVKKLTYNKGTTTWSISITGNGALVENGTTTYGSFRYNASAPRFTTYTSSVSSTMLLPSIYMLDNSAGITYYTTDSCHHENTRIMDAQEPSCTVTGYTEGVYCTDCDRILSGGEWIAALGHNCQQTEDGYICTVCGYIPGDINDDGVLNNKDVIRLFQYLSDWDVEVNETALDVNNDGYINNKDVIRLFQYLSDWDVDIY